MLIKKSHLDAVRKLEAFLITKQKVHEVDTLTVEDPKEILKTSELKENPKISLPEKDVTGSRVTFEGIKPQRFIKVQAKVVIDKTTKESGVPMFKYDPITKTIKLI